MKVYYLHHAERDINSNIENKQEEDITESGIQEALLIAEKLKGQNITAIYSSTYKRCIHTAQIINKYLDVPIIFEKRFNEKEKSEEWQALLKRNMDAIDDIVKKYHENDTVICVTSGVNISAFICYFYNIKPTNNVCWTQAGNCSLINFTTDNKVD